ncbi:MAG: phosphoglycerate dehydrogenase [Clostridia bacterium]|nr:phosphoglycerate dehydrogenase [Clostridia bacterium]
MYEISQFNKIAKEGIKLLPGDRYKVGESSADSNAILIRSYKLTPEEIGKNVLCISRAGAGVNNIPVKYCSERGIVVFNTPGANANAVKELVICGLLLASRDIAGSIEFAKTLKGQEKINELVESSKSLFSGVEIAGKTLGIIGLGAIGVMVANCASAMNMEVIGYDPYLSVDSAWGLSRKVKKAKSLDELYQNSDYVTIHVPLIESTKHMINDDSIGKMKKGIRILNFARGELVNNTSVLKAVREGKVARYISDFPSEELIGEKNIICIPHLGASTYESEVNCAVMAVREVKDFLENGNITNSVNMPGCQMDRTSDVRITVIHKNIPNMLGQISTTLAKENINILNMTNRGREEFAYTLLDISSDVNDKILEKLNAIDGVLRTRLIK